MRSDQRGAIRLDRVSFAHREGPDVLDEVNLDIEPGGILTLVGRSGAGKSTLLKLVNGLLRPTIGRVLVGGLSTEHWDPIRLRRGIGYVLQEIGLFPHMTVAANAGLVLQLEGWPASRIAARVEELLVLVGLSPSLFARRMPAELSGGQRQRVGVARALAADPPILLMDEPFGALDPVTRRDLRREFRLIQSRIGTTVILVTHDMQEALDLGTRVAVLDAGRLVVHGLPGEILASTDPRVQVLL